MPIEIVPLASRQTRAKARCARAWTGGWVVTIDDGSLDVLTLDLAPRAQLAVGDAHDVAVRRDGAVVVVATADELQALDVTTGRPQWIVDGAWLSCWLGDDDVLWAAARIDDATLEVSVRDLATGVARRSVRIGDELGASHLMFVAAPSPREVIAWVAAGQDGARSFAVRDSGAALVAREVGPRDCTPPRFSPTGDAFVTDNASTLEHCAWPSGESLGGVWWPDDDDELADDQPKGDVQFLHGGFATWATDNGRVLVVDLARHEIVDELHFASPPGDFRYSVAGAGDLVLTLHGDSTLLVSRRADWVGAARRG